MSVAGDSGRLGMLPLDSSGRIEMSGSRLGVRGASLGECRLPMLLAEGLGLWSELLVLEVEPSEPPLGGREREKRNAGEYDFTLVVVGHKWYDRGDQYATPGILEFRR